ncbi:MAG: hypothetical protein OXC00_15255 [Acidimicrobiaceae bacterium]|nr:hypothetical protein [Acidimicrobiaceae bacterium]
MRGSVLLVVASLGLATVGSVLLWAARRITWRRPASYLRQLEAVSIPGKSVGPASGISRLDPLQSDDAADTAADGAADTAADTAADAAGDAPSISER